MRFRSFPITHIKLKTLIKRNQHVRFQDLLSPCCRIIEIFWINFQKSDFEVLYEIKNLNLKKDLVCQAQAIHTAQVKAACILFTLEEFVSASAQRG